MAKGIISINNHSSSGGGGTTIDLLWSNDGPSENTNYALTNSIENYDWIRIIYRTNTELQSQEIPVDVVKLQYGTNWGISATYFGHTDGGQTDLLTYRTTGIVKFQSATTFKYTAMYNNQNLKVKPIRIYGINY